MQDLIARLEKATGPDRELDHAIVLEVPITKAFLQADKEGGFEVLRYTASIDAALTLVPEGPYVLIVRQQDGSGTADIRSMTIAEGCDAATPAIALCIAALKVITQEKK